MPLHKIISHTLQWVRRPGRGPHFDNFGMPVQMAWEVGFMPTTILATGCGTISDEA